jgi:hypothetical protein
MITTESKMKKMIAVLAGTHREFKEFSRNNTDKNLVFCDGWPKFAGLVFSEFIEIGTFRSRPDALEIYVRVLPMVRPNV